MNWTATLAAVVVGYLCGSLSFARIVYGWKRPGEVPPPLRVPTLDGEKEIVVHAVGGTSVMLGLGPRWGMFVSALDILKGFLPVLAFRLLVPGDYYLVAAVAVLLGHVWPAWYRFQGSGGNSVILGSMLAISPIGLIVTQAVGGVLGMVVPMFGFATGNLLMIPWFWWRDGLASPEVAYAVTVNVIYFAGQLPHARAVIRLRREGHRVDSRAVMRQMRGSVKRQRDDA